MRSDPRSTHDEMGVSLGANRKSASPASKNGENGEVCAARDADCSYSPGQTHSSRTPHSSRPTCSPQFASRPERRPALLVRLAAPITLIALLAVWQLVCTAGLIPPFMLPSPLRVAQALVGDWSLLAQHAATSLVEAGLGLGAGVALGFVAALAMDRFELLYRAFYPIVVLTQTIPTVAIAPLLVLWFGYGMLPKVVLIVVATFFPITVGLLEGLRSVDPDEIDLMRAMGATRVQILRHVKLPAALPQFFSGLKISAAYAIVGAVIAEWLGGFSGLGVYMTRVRKAYSFDKMFAVIFLISGLSLVLMWAVEALRRALMPWERRTDSLGSSGAQGGHREDSRVKTH